MPRGGRVLCTYCDQVRMSRIAVVYIRGTSDTGREEDVGQYCAVGRTSMDSRNVARSLQTTAVRALPMMSAVATRRIARGHPDFNTRQTRLANTLVTISNIKLLVYRIATSQAYIRG
jgi:hypothetical protein